MYDSQESDDNQQLLRLCAKIREHRALLIDKIKDINDILATMDGVEKTCLAQLTCLA